MFYLIYKIFSSLSDRERRVLLGAFLMFLVSLFFISLNFYYSATTEKPARDGTYIEGLIGQPTFINPLIIQTNNVDLDLTGIFFSNLFDLIDNYKTSPDNKTWTLSLKENLKWGDGHNLTSDDVIFTIKTIQDPDVHSLLFSNWQEINLEKLNDEEIRFHLKTPYSFFVDNLKSLRIAPQHIFGNIPPTNLKLSKYNLEPVGNGPYKFGGFLTEKDGFISQLSLLINSFYHDQSPFIPEFIFKFYQNETDLIKDFNLKKISGFGGINPKNLNEIKIKHKIFNLSLPRYYAIFFNSSGHPALQEKEVRLALNLAVNKKQIIKKIFNGHASLADGPIPSSLTSYNKEVYKDDIFSLEKARQVLEEAGWLINPDDGARYKTINKNRSKLEFEIFVPQVPFLIETVDLIKNDWNKIGVILKPIIVAIDDMNKEILKTRNYQIIIFGNILNNSDVFAFWHSSERFYPGLNLSLYNNKEADLLLEKIHQESNLEKRKGDFDKLQKLIHDDTPAIFLFNPNYLYVTSDELRGFNLALIISAANRFENVAQWHLKTERRFAKK